MLPRDPCCVESGSRCGSCVAMKRTLKTTLKSFAITTLGVTVKSVGLGVAVVGLSGYAAFQLVAWPVRSYLGRRKGT